MNSNNFETKSLLIYKFAKNVCNVFLSTNPQILVCFSVFFYLQINTQAAEVLYQSAIDLGVPTERTTVMDICCGTGTIGLCFAKVI